MKSNHGVWWAAALYAVLTVAFAYPLSVRPGDSVFGDNADTHFYLWTLSWDVHAFVHQPFSIFDANIYYPYRYTLAYSENMIGSALLVAAVTSAALTVAGSAAVNYQHSERD